MMKNGYFVCFLTSSGKSPYHIQLIVYISWHRIYFYKKNNIGAKSYLEPIWCYLSTLPWIMDNVLNLAMSTQLHSISQLLFNILITYIQIITHYLQLVSKLPHIYIIHYFKNKICISLIQRFAVVVYMLRIVNHEAKVMVISTTLSPEERLITLENSCFIILHSVNIN